MSGKEAHILDDAMELVLDLNPVPTLNVKLTGFRRRVSGTVAPRAAVSPRRQEGPPYRCPAT